MRHKVQLLIITILLLSITKSSYAQLSVDAEFRPRFEYRHGYKTLFPEGAAPAAFVSQRSRLNIDLKKEQYRFYMSIQDVRVWGDLPQLNRHDTEGLGLHEIWGELNLSDKFNLRIGRQELILDDSRILGNVGWAQQARSHDLILLNWKNNNWQAKLAAAFNQEDERLQGNDYHITNNYKAMQLLWLHKDWEKYSLSLLALNNGLQYLDSAKVNGVRFSQTVGFHFERNVEASKLAIKSYYQMGENRNGEALEAYLVGIDYLKDLSPSLKLGLGGEIMSGNSNGLVNGNTNRAFEPLYGTNHKFNGYMDYFYVGFHGNSVGLIDLNASIHYALNSQSNIMLRAHEFLVPTEIADDSFRELGTELDLVFSHQVNKEVSLSVGYSHMFQQSTLEKLRNIEKTKTNNFVFVSLSIKPNLFKMDLNK